MFTVQSKTEPVIKTCGLVKTYRTGEGEYRAVGGLDLQIEGGEFVAVVGKSGSGKSTLLNLLAGIDRATSGEIYVKGEAVHRMAEAELSVWRGLNIGVVFQFFQLLPTLTVIENIMLPMDFCRKYTPLERKARALVLLDKVGVRGQAAKLPFALSGGEQQRVAIARALANDPGIIMADEPTGNLDTATTENVFGLLEGLAREGKTVMIVTHNQELAGRTGRLIEIRDGRIIRDSKTSQAGMEAVPC
jgi:putative ABC transport system ATP-binding protein